MMLNIFSNLKGTLKVKTVLTDSAVFRLNYRATAAILVICSVTITLREYMGDPIICQNAVAVAPQKMLDNFCWIESTYTVDSAHYPGKNEDVPYPGIMNGHHDDRRYLGYYQWVCFCLFFQAILFYFPRRLWKAFERGRLEGLVKHLRIGLAADRNERQKRIQAVVDFLVNSRHQHNIFPLYYMICELVALLNVIGQLYLMDAFFDGWFLKYGLAVINLISLPDEQRDSADPFIFVFPRMSMCTYRMYGNNGEIQPVKTLCLLPQNILNEKIYIFLWFWFLFLAVITSVALVSHVATMVLPGLRTWLFLNRFWRIEKRVERLRMVLDRCQVGDWFLLYTIGTNISDFEFRNLMISYRDNTMTYPIRPRKYNPHDNAKSPIVHAADMDDDHDATDV